MDWPVRESKLADPVAALGTAYLKCRAIKVSLLEPLVPVADYPKGYFGDWVEDGVLVRARHEFADEDRMRQLFALLAESVTGSEDEDNLPWLGEAALDESAGDYRREAGFVSEWSIEFVGEVPLRLEFDLEARRLLVEAGDRWDSYELDRPRADALGKFIASF